MSTSANGLPDLHEQAVDTVPAHAESLCLEWV
jgi:hypothetical protein